MTDAMMGSEQPRLQIREGNVNHRQMSFRPFGIAVENHWFVCVSHRRQVIVPAPAIGAHNRLVCDVVSHKSRKRLGLSVGNDAQSQSARVTLPFWKFTVFLSRLLANFDSTNYCRHMVNPTPLALCSPSNKSLVNFDRVLRSDGVALWSDHAGAKFMQELKGRLIARQPQLSLKLKCRLAGSLCRDEIGTPKPDGQWRTTGPHHRAGGKRDVSVTGAAAQNYRRSFCKAIRLPYRCTLGTHKPLRPPKTFQIFCTSLIIREYLLEFGESRREASGIHSLNLTPK